MTEQLDLIAQNFVTELATDERLADKNATEAISAIANGDEDVYLALRTEVAKKIQALLEAQLRNEVAEVNVEAIEVDEAPVEEPTELVEHAPEEVEAPVEGVLTDSSEDEE